MSPDGRIEIGRSEFPHDPPGLTVWFPAGRRSKEVRLTTGVIERFGIDRQAKYRGLSALEKAGLVRVHRKPRRNPLTIWDWPEQRPAVVKDRRFEASCAWVVLACCSLLQ